MFTPPVAFSARCMMFLSTSSLSSCESRTCYQRSHFTRMWTHYKTSASTICKYIPYTYDILCLQKAMLEITKKGGFVFTTSLEIAVVEDHEHRRRRHSTLTSCHGLGRKPEIVFDAEVSGRGLSEIWRTMAYLCSMNSKQADQA